MNHWQYEQYKQLDEFSRQRILSEVRAENLVRQFRAYHPNMFERVMFSLANWMISKGKQLRHRYDIPASNGSQRTFDNLI